MRGIIEAIRSAYAEGFAASAEGWNGEYGFYASDQDRYWVETRDKALSDILARVHSDLDAIQNEREPALSTAREEGRREGLEEAAKHLDAWSERHLARFSEKFQTHEGHAASVLEYAAEAIRALKEKQP